MRNISVIIDKAESLAIDCLTQFRAGVHEVIINNELVLIDSEIYNTARGLPYPNDEENIIKLLVKEIGVYAIGLSFQNNSETIDELNKMEVVTQ